MTGTGEQECVDLKSYEYLCWEWNLDFQANRTSSLLSKQSYRPLSAGAEAERGREKLFISAQGL